MRDFGNTAKDDAAASGKAAPLNAACVSSSGFRLTAEPTSSEGSLWTVPGGLWRVDEGSQEHRFPAVRGPCGHPG